MMVFYVLLYYVWRKRYEIKGRAGLIAAVYGLAAARVILCMMPQNQWLSADAPLSWGIYRNIPFALLGILVIVLFYRSAREQGDRAFGWMWLTIVLSFAFYIPVVLWADTIPMIGMLMIPKTCAYVWTVLIGYFAMSAEERRRLPIEGIGSLLFGLWLIIMPGFFADLLTFVLGFILVLGGVQQIASLSAARRWMPVRVGFYIIPVLILIAGLVALFNPTGVRSTAFIIIGITSIVYAVSELINWFTFTRKRPKAPGTPGASSKAVDNIEDAEIIE